MVGSVAVVVVNYRTASLALDAVLSLVGERGRHPRLRVIIVDGGSADGSADYLIAGVVRHCLSDWVEVLPLPINGGFGWANNQAILTMLTWDCPPEYIYLLNPDAQIEPGAIEALAAVLDADSCCAAVGSLLLEGDGNPSGSAFRFPSIGRELLRGSGMDRLGRYLRIEPMVVRDATAVDWVTGASVMLRVAALKDVGLFDTGFFLYFEEVELMWRMDLAGWTVRHEDASRVRHIGGAATGLSAAKPGWRSAPRLPGYWFRSRLRFFALTHGRAKTIAASLAWLSGRLIAGLLSIAAGRRSVQRCQWEARDLLAKSTFATGKDSLPAVTRWTDPIGDLPYWLIRT